MSQEKARRRGHARRIAIAFRSAQCAVYLFLLREQACFLVCGCNLKVLQMEPVFQPTSLVRKNTECQIDSTCFSVGLGALGVQEVARKTGKKLPQEAVFWGIARKFADEIDSWVCNAKCGFH